MRVGQKMRCNRPRKAFDSDILQNKFYLCGGLKR